ncbi:hypothetical protein AVEN_55670-1 [Araneus ventricosus]|uniref:Uncharacterized protein n=1 Tax=Araneus ventricosus TaxID=182803 RepID=A0A4Y2CBM1_ARAVE|nr:hypothetical protein AVEN_36408-1 [Araneus ventricosus]GBM01781.1 hypothetical protein AVEN_46042-1 [Araneus ventricosus]GBM01791.1 hypothetical protein AVEN_51561-1 [Araneus ventricosus]GBM01801.1 hypothetical protein AVEN_55670-1 [Araneus ventricosus]
MEDIQIPKDTPLSLSIWTTIEDIYIQKNTKALPKHPENDGRYLDPEEYSALLKHQDNNGRYSDSEGYSALPKHPENVGEIFIFRRILRPA